MTIIGRRTLRDRRNLLVGAAAIAVIIVVLLSSNTFLSGNNLAILLNQTPPLILGTIGLTLVMAVGGIDLSIGSILAVSAGLVGFAVAQSEMALPVAILLGLGAGLAAGALNGWLISYAGLPSFIVTLGMLEAARGLAYLVSGSQTIYIGKSIEGLSMPLPIIRVSGAFLAAITISLLAHIALTRSVAGRHLIAIGTSEAAARASGIETRPYRLAVFAVSGALAALAGVFNASYLAAADPNAGSGLELSAIAAAVIGGTSLAGGRASILGGLMGVALIMVLQSGLAQAGISEPVKRLVTGLVIILAVLLDSWRTRSGASSRAA